MSIGKQVEMLLKRNGVSRFKLSKDTGIPYTTLTQIINGRTKDPQISALETVADYFGVSLDYLTGQSAKALIENRLKSLGESLEWLSEQTKIPLEDLRLLDDAQPMPWNSEKDGIIDRISKATGLDRKELAAAFARQEPPVYEGPRSSVEEDFADVDFEESDIIEAVDKELTEDEILTLAAHKVGHEGALSKEQLAQIKLAMKIALAKEDV